MSAAAIGLFKVHLRTRFALPGARAYNDRHLARHHFF